VNRAPSPARARRLARLLLTLAAISAVVVLVAAVVVPSIAMPEAQRAIVDAARYIGPPLSLVTGVLALVHARRSEQRSRRTVVEPDGASIVFRGMLLVAASVMILGLLSALWSALVLGAGDLLR